MTDTAESLDVTITYLQMHQPPRRPHAHAQSGRKMALLRAERPPLRFYRYLYETVGEPWLWYERRTVSDDALTTIIHDDRIEIFVLYVDGCPAGFFELDRRGLPDVELTYCGLVPDYIGQGLGLFLIDQAVEQAWRAEPTPQRLWVHTCTLDHPRALIAYQHAGFTAYRQEHERIADPRQSGAMRSRLA